MHRKRPAWHLVAGIMVVVLTITVVSVLRPSSVISDSDLTAEVQRVFGVQRTESLHDLAHQRAVEISTNFSHAGMRGADAEVIAWNSSHSEVRAVQQWLGSPPHAAILSNPDYGSIGCGSYATPDATYYACLLSRGTPPAPTPAPAPAPTPASTPSAPTPGAEPPQPEAPAPTSTPEPVLLPNTATRSP